MKAVRWIALVATGLSVAASAQDARSASAAAATPKVTLTRLDCGRAAKPRELTGFSDTFASYRRALVSSCYLVRHGDELMLWDTGYPVAMRDDPKAELVMPLSVVDQLRQLGVDPARVTRVAISHYHADHTGQARDFPNATLLIGAGDWAALTAADRPASLDPAPLARWVSGGGKVEPIRRDKDVWGDGSVVILDTPGHTPWHHSLLVRLPVTGPVLLTWDLAHFTENYATNGVPRFNTDRADTLASLDRFKGIARNLRATVIIQHEPADVAKLPAFPKAAE